MNVRDVLAILVRLREALEDGDVSFAVEIAEELEDDLAGWLATTPEERAA
jgi:hypothetical protein